MTGVVSPCSRDCRERSCGCQVSCTRWAAYVAARNDQYEAALREKNVSDAYWGVTSRSHGTPLVEAGGGEPRKTRQLR